MHVQIRVCIGVIKIKLDYGVHINSNCIKPLYKNKRSDSNVSCTVIPNFVFVGRAIIYEIQRCIYRLQIDEAHNKLITTIYVSIFNDILISIASGDGNNSCNFGMLQMRILVIHVMLKEILFPPIIKFNNIIFECTLCPSGWSYKG